jgi:hypothetical protein
MEDSPKSLALNNLALSKIQAEKAEISVSRLKE